jgi:RNA polymerase sigma-70 factor, ECF subfamily
VVYVFEGFGSKTLNPFKSIQSADSPAEKSDEELLARICEDDRQALAELFRRYSRIVRGIALRLLHDRSEADDMLQDVFLLVHKQCRKYDPSKSSARFWLLQMSHCRTISRWRHLNSRHFYSHTELEKVAEVLPAPASTLPQFGKATAQKMFAALTPDQRETLRLYFFEGYTLPEIAAVRDKHIGAVKNHYFRGLDKLRTQIFGKESRLARNGRSEHPAGPLALPVLEKQ